MFLRPRCLRDGQDGPAPAQEFEGVETVSAAEIDRRQGVIFAGGWDLAGAAAVCGPDGPSAALPDRVMSLIEKSLVSREPDREGESHYSMLETIRSYAIERLQEAGELRAVQRCHAQYFLTLFDRDLRIRTGEAVAHDDASGDTRPPGELANLRVALAFSLAEGDLELALHLAAVGRSAWGMGGAMIEGRAWMTRVLDLSEDLQTAVRARALVSLGECERVLGNARPAAQRYEEALDLSERLGDRPGVLSALIQLIELTAETNDHAHERLLSSARTLADEVGNDFDRARLLIAGAGIETRSGRFERADAMLDEGLDLMRNRGVPGRVWAWQLVSVGYTALERQDFKRARSAFEEYLAETSAKRPIGTATAHCNLGHVALYEHQPNSADEHLRRALVLARETEAKVLIAECLFGMAAVAAMDGDPERASRLWGAAETLKEATSVPLSSPERFIIDQCLEPAQATLADAVHATARAEGVEMSLGGAIRYALGEPN